jgi:hypothetical protein
VALRPHLAVGLPLSGKTSAIGQGANQVPGLFRPTPDTVPVVIHALRLIPQWFACSEKVQTVIVVPSWASRLRCADHGSSRRSPAAARFSAANPSACREARAPARRHHRDRVPDRRNRPRWKRSRRSEMVQTYWIRSEEGRWYSVSAVEFGTAQVGRHEKVCR